jgi:small subunit ribosomal protein S17
VAEEEKNIASDADAPDASEVEAPPEVEETPEAEAETPEPEAVEAPAVDEPVAEEAAELPAEEPVEPEAEAAPEAEPVAPAKTKSQRHVPRSLRRARSKAKREAPATRKPITRTEKPATEPARRQERRGVVVSDKGDKTIVVKVDVIKSHAKYRKVVRRSVKFQAHDEQNAAGIGDTVRIVESRPISKTKHWRLAEVVEKAR